MRIKKLFCRWKKSAAIVDVIPASDIGFGFGNQWYPLAIKTAGLITLPNGIEIKLISAPAFVASKIESFYGRGNGDYGHHDLEDIINIIYGREELKDEIMHADKTIHEFVVEEFDNFLSDLNFTD